MRIALIGASGFAGNTIFEELMHRGHQVTSIFRDANKINATNNVTVVSADALNETEVTDAVAGHDAVISTYNAGWITATDFPKTIHDFGGFPQEHFDVQYPAPGNSLFANETAELLHSAHVELDHDWGLDHGAWTVVRHMYSAAAIPVLQLSIDYTKGPQYHYDLASELYALRKKGVLIIGSGNMVHNLRMVAGHRLNDAEYGYDWATNINDKFKSVIQDGDHKPQINYSTLGKDALLAIPTPEHYLPMMYTLGVKGPKDDISFFSDKAVGGSLTMTSVKVGISLHNAGYVQATAPRAEDGF